MSMYLAFLLLGLLFLGGLVADEFGRRTRLPRVTLLLALGIVAGKSGLALIPAEASFLFEPLSVTALTMVAFLLGGSLTRKKLAQSGREVLILSVVIVAATWAIVAAGLMAAGAGTALALILGALACATDPAATRDAIEQSGQNTPFSDKLKAIVAIDDAWGLIVFSLALIFAHGLSGALHLSLLADLVWEIGGAAMLGLAIGLPGAFLTGRVHEGEPLQAEALGIVFLTAGLALWLEVSYLIAAMIAGAVIADRARHHTRAFHEIERIQWPFMILFFVLAGAELDLHRLQQIGWLGAGYVALRVLARILGGWLGARLGHSPKAETPWFGPALLPQAGVAVGMALVAASEFPDIAETILTLTIGATVIFELAGPALTLIAARKVGQTKQQ